MVFRLPRCRVSPFYMYQDFSALNPRTPSFRIHNQFSRAFVVGQVALRYVYQQPSQFLLTVQSHEPDHDAQDMEIFNFSLTASELAALDAVTSA